MLHREPRSACNGSAGFVAHCATASACHRSAIPGPTGLAMVGNSQAAIVGRGKEWLALEFRIWLRRARKFYDVTEMPCGG